MLLQQRLPAYSAAQPEGGQQLAALSSLNISQLQSTQTLFCGFHANVANARNQPHTCTNKNIKHHTSGIGIALVAAINLQTTLSPK